MNEQAIFPLAGPLAGQTVLVTRPKNQAYSLAEMLERQGASVLLQRVIEIREPADWAVVDAAIKRIGEFSWLVFVSVNGVQFFLARCETLGVGLDQFKSLKIAAIGSKTSEELQRIGLTVSLLPDEFDSGGLASAMINQNNSKNANPFDTEKILLIRADRGSVEIPEAFAAAKIEFEQIAVYQSTDAETADPKITAAMQRCEIDWVTVTSSAIGRSLVNLFGEELRKTKLVSISPTTSEQLSRLGFAPTAEATEYHMAGLVAAIIRKP